MIVHFYLLYDVKNGQIVFNTVVQSEVIIVFLRGCKFVTYISHSNLNCWKPFEPLVQESHRGDAARVQEELLGKDSSLVMI
jgi:hypothetical protein